MRGKTVILIDDGIATGSTMRAAVRALNAQHPARSIVAVPTRRRLHLPRTAIGGG